MIKLAYCNIENLNWIKAYKLLSEHRKQKVDKFRFIKDKKLSSGAYLLLTKLLAEENVRDPIFKFEKFGKAYISNYENIHFNLSHSGKIVACAISDRKVGIDVEYNDPAIDLSIAKNYFHNQEYENIMKSENPSNDFFNYWVLKESYMKYTGLGFHLDLDSFEIAINEKITLKNDKNNLKFNLFDIGNYKLAVCCEYDVFDYTQYSAEELFDF